MIYSILDVVIVGAGDFRSPLTYGIPESHIASSAALNAFASDRDFR